MAYDIGCWFKFSNIFKQNYFFKDSKAVLNCIPAGIIKSCHKSDHNVYRELHSRLLTEKF